MRDCDLLKDTPELTAAIKRDRERIMNEADKQTMQEVRKRRDLEPDVREYRSHDELRQYDADIIFLLRIADSQALEIERLNKIIDEISDEGNR